MMDKDIVIVKPPKRVRDWEGCYVMSVVEFKTYYMAFPRHTVFQITTSGPKKTLKSMLCQCCGIAAFLEIRKNQRMFLEDFRFVELRDKNDGSGDS